MTSSARTSARVSATTERARAFVAKKMPRAAALGRTLAELISDPDAFERELEAGFRALGDPEYRDAQAWIVPGVGDVLGVRRPLVRATARPVRSALRDASSAYAIYLAERLIHSRFQDVRLFAHYAIERALLDDPERGWQLIRRVARRANEWETVDNLANVVAAGILREPYRWAEIEQLVHSPHKWERRLVGSTIATLPFAIASARRHELERAPALDVLRSLIGDGDRDVQKALSWALRSWALVNQLAVEAFLEDEARLAADSADGNRAWVIRDALGAIRPELAEELRQQLSGIRRHRDALSTSRAAETAREFAGLPDAHHMPEGPLTV